MRPRRRSTTGSAPSRSSNWPSAGKCQAGVHLEPACDGRPSPLPVTEAHPTNPLTAYHASKLYGEHLVAIAARRLPAVSLRLTAPVGPGMPAGRILTVFVRRALAGEQLTVAGEGRAHRTTSTSATSPRGRSRRRLRCTGLFNVASGTSCPQPRAGPAVREDARLELPVPLSGEPDPEEGCDGRCRSSAPERRSATSPTHTRGSIAAVAQDATPKVTHAESPAVPDYDRIWDEVYGDLQDLGPTHRHMIRLMRRVLAPLQYASVLDVGVGFGHNLPALTDGRRIERLAGIDVSERALEHVRGRWTGEFVRADITAGITRPPTRGALRGACSSTPPMTSRAAPDAAMSSRYLLRRRSAARTSATGRGSSRSAMSATTSPVSSSASSRPRASRGLDMRWGFPFYTPLARRLQNRMTVTHELSASSRLAARILYPVFFLNSSRRGDLLVALARPADPCPSGSSRPGWRSSCRRSSRRCPPPGSSPADATRTCHSCLARSRSWSSLRRRWCSRASQPPPAASFRARACSSRRWSCSPRAADPGAGPGRRAESSPGHPRAVVPRS